MGLKDEITNESRSAAEDLRRAVSRQLYSIPPPPPGFRLTLRVKWYRLKQRIPYEIRRKR